MVETRLVINGHYSYNYILRSFNLISTVGDYTKGIIVGKLKLFNYKDECYIFKCNIEDIDSNYNYNIYQLTKIQSNYGS